jgi:hypothetical protein
LKLSREVWLRRESDTLSGTWENHDLVAIYRVDGWENRKIMGWIGRGIETVKIMVEEV